MIYTDKEKCIYTSPIGTLHDPVQIVNKLTAFSGGLFNEWMGLWCDHTANKSDAAKAALMLADVGRKAFDFKPLTTEGGFGDGAVLETVHHFTEYLSKK